MSYMMHDERDVNVILKMAENSRYNFLVFGARKIPDSVSMGTGRTSVAEVLESFEDSYNDVIQEYIAPIYESVEYLWTE